jgi:hypothetical protein
MISIKYKAKLSLIYAMKVLGRKRGSKINLLLILDLTIRCDQVVSIMPQPCSTPGKGT